MLPVVEQRGPFGAIGEAFEDGIRIVGGGCFVAQRDGWRVAGQLQPRPQQEEARGQQPQRHGRQPPAHGG